MLLQSSLRAMGTSPPIVENQMEKTGLMQEDLRKPEHHKLLMSQLLIELDFSR